MALAVSVERLRGEVAEITDWRKQLDEHQRGPRSIGAARRRLRRSAAGSRRLRARAGAAR